MWVFVMLIQIFVIVFFLWKYIIIINMRMSMSNDYGKENELERDYEQGL